RARVFRGQRVPRGGRGVRSGGGDVWSTNNDRGVWRVFLLGGWGGGQPTQTRALRNMRIQAPSSLQSSGYQEFCTARKTRSGCGIMMVTRPSRVVRPVMPRGEPLGLAG